MSVKDITTQIEKKAQNRVAEINAELEKELSSLKEKYEKVISDRETLIKKSVERKGEEIKNGIVTREKISAKNNLLREKQKIVQGVFNDFFSKISGLTVDKYVSFYASILKENQITGRKYTLIKVETDDRINQNFVAELAKAADVELTLSEQKISGKTGGFILKSDYLELDFTYEAVMRTLRENRESDIVKILFKTTE
ncbi:MAG: V-type ATP synthase subunit E [Candidatus Muiribacteriota bacterium]